MFKNISFGRIALVFGIFVALTLIAIPSYKWYDTHRELVVERFHVKTLQADSTSAFARILEEKLGRLQAEKKFHDSESASALSAAKFDANIARANSKVDAVVATYTAKQLKTAADVKRAGVGAVSTTEADTALNRDFTILKDKYKVLEDSIPILHKRIGVLETQVSDLENELNGTKIQRDDAISSSLYAEGKFNEEAGKKRFLGVGRKAAMRKGAQEVRLKRIGAKTNP